MLSRWTIENPTSMRTGPIALPARRSSMIRPGVSPICVRGIDSVVNAGTICVAISESSKPAIATRPGTLQPRRWHSKSAPIAKKAIAQVEVSERRLI